MRPEHHQAYGMTVHLVMGGWYPLCFALFIMLRPARAVAAALVTGFLLLPNASYDLPGIPTYDKAVAIVCGVALSVVLFDPGRLLRFRPRWVDAPAALLVLCPLLSSLVNGDGAYLGMSNSFDLFIRWGMPWVLGRLYFGDFESQKVLALSIVVGALVYVLPALYEVKMSPQLHLRFYGIAQKSFKHAMRDFGLWRPNVFIAHGLAYGLFNALAALLAFWLWFTRARRAVLGMPMGFVALVLTGMAFAAQSMNALCLLFVGGICLVVGARWRWGIPLALLIGLPPSYVAIRQGLRWDGEELVEVAASVFGKARAISLNVRLQNEAHLADRILEKLWFGYNDFGEFTGNVDGHFVATVDSLWLLYIGLYGLVALVGLYGFQLMPSFLLWRKIPPRYWAHPLLASGVALGLCSLLAAMDGLFNAIDLAAITAGAGGVAQLLGTREGRRLWTDTEPCPRAVPEERVRAAARQPAQRQLG